MTTDAPAADPAAPDAAPRLGALPGWLRPFLLLPWLALAVLAMTAEAGGIWAGLQSEYTLTELLLMFGVGLIAAVALIATAALLVWQRPGDLVAYLLSLSALSAAAYVGPATFFYGAFGLELMETILPSLWIGLLVAALPAFPDGRFIPAWGRWLTIGAAPYTLLLCADTITHDDRVVLATTILGFSVALLTIAAAIVRFRRTPRGLARQQLKWAALGVACCMALLIGAIGTSYALDAGAFPEEWALWVQIALLAMRDLSFLLLALGFLMSLLRLRLWDADRAIGRSLAYFLLTLILACVWAASATLVNDFVAAQVGGGKGLSAALSTIVAALVFGPARERVNKWVDKRLRRGVMQLRKLPDRLAIWQSLDDPAAFGGRVAQAVSDGLHAPRVAILLFEDRAFRVLATERAAAAEVEAWIAARGSFSELDAEERDDADFPLRLILTDEEVLIGAILVGRRSDGSAHAKEERATLFGLEPALAASLHRVQRRTMSNRAVGSAIDELDQRIGRIEQRVGPAA